MIYLTPAQKALRKHRNVADRITAKIEVYAADPASLANMVTEMRGSTGKRLRVGDFRARFEETEIIVTDIGPRGDVYDCGSRSMTNATFVTTPGGEELAILPRRAYEDLRDAAHHAAALADYRAGRDRGLNAVEMRDMLAAPTPLAFWRRHRGLSQQALAEATGISQNHLSDLENGRRVGSIKLWAGFARALDVPIDSLVDDGGD